MLDSVLIDNIHIVNINVRSEQSIPTAISTSSAELHVSDDLQSRHNSIT